MQLNVTTWPLYYWTGTVLVANIILIAVSRAGFDSSDLAPMLGFGLGTALFFLVFSRLADAGCAHSAVPVLRNLCEVLLFLQLSWLNLRLLNHLSMMMPVPLWDDRLARWDATLGLDWMAYFEWVHARPGFAHLLDLSYTSLTLLSVVALIGLILMGQPRRARFFCTIFFTTALICIIAGAFFPALAAVDYHVTDLDAYSGFSSPPGVYHLSHLQALRDPSVSVLLKPGNLPGLVTFPSFHTAAGVLLCAAYYNTRLFIPVTGYALVMIAATPVWGGHYFVDLIAGTGVALAVIAYFGRQAAYRNLFARESRPLRAAARIDLGPHRS